MAQELFPQFIVKAVGADVYVQDIQEVLALLEKLQLASLNVHMEHVNLAIFLNQTIHQGCSGILLKERDVAQVVNVVLTEVLHHLPLGAVGINENDSAGATSTACKLPKSLGSLQGPKANRGTRFHEHKVPFSSTSGPSREGRQERNRFKIILPWEGTPGKTPTLQLSCEFQLNLRIGHLSLPALMLNAKPVGRSCAGGSARDLGLQGLARRGPGLDQFVMGETCIRLPRIERSARVGHMLTCATCCMVGQHGKNLPP